MRTKQGCFAPKNRKNIIKYPRR